MRAHPTPRDEAPCGVPLQSGSFLKEAEEWWGAVGHDGVVVEARTGCFLRARGIEEWRVARPPLEAAVALRPGLPCPPWASWRGRSWADAGWSLVLRCYSPRGELVGLRARWTGGPAPGAGWFDLPSPGPVELWPSGIPEPRVALYADPVARWVLGSGGRARKGDRPDPAAPGLRWDGLIMVSWGAVAWLRDATWPTRVEMDTDGWGWTAGLVGLWPGAMADPTDLAKRLAGARVILDMPKGRDRALLFRALLKAGAVPLLMGG